MKLLISFLFLMLVVPVFSQGTPWQENVKWNFEVKKVKNNENQRDIIGHATLFHHYHIFSVHHDPLKADLTGTPTEFKLKKSPNFKTIGKIQDVGVPIKFEDELGVQLYFDKKASFKQRIEVMTNKDFKLELSYSFQICDSAGCQFPPEQEIILDIQGNLENSSSSQTDNSTQDTSKATADNSDSNASDEDSTITTTVEQTIIKVKQEQHETGSNWTIFIAGFLAGLIALFTPCMFPMIPMTVTFFTKQSKTKSEGIFKAMIYGISIVVIYVTFGLIFTAATGPIGLNDLSTNMWMNLIFFAVFMLFAFSFLGAFEIQLPSSWVNKMDKQADKGGYIGIFFMAFTLGLVSFSCTGPIIGSLLVEAATSGSYYTPAIGMTGFSLALAIPFTLFAVFPGWLNSLPQSGGWLNSVKVCLGLLEIAFALKFLSAVDLAYHWDILTREWFIGTWFVIFAVMGFYLLGKIRFAHDSPIEKLSVTRFMFAFMSLTFAVYLLPGMWGAPIKLLSGIAPPTTYSEDKFLFNHGGLDNGLIQDEITAKYIEYMHASGDGSIMVFHDLTKAKEYAKERNLPIMIDFTGYACQNCRKMETSVWADESIKPILQKRIVIASLYVDDHSPLPEDQHRYSDIIGGKVKEVGNVWAELQIERYKSYQQPLYAIIDHDDNDLVQAVGYTPDVYEFKNFLMTGIDNFKKNSELDKKKKKK